MGFFLSFAATFLFAHMTVAVIHKRGNLVVTNAVVNPVRTFSRDLKSLLFTNNHLRMALGEQL